MSSKPDKSKEKKKIPVPCIVAAAVILCLIIGYLIAAAVLGSFNPTKWKEEESVNVTPAVTCAILYPDLQDNGEIWQTGGMEQTSAKTMREALETDFNKGFFTFADDGTIASVGNLTAANGYKFTIQKNTTRAPEKLSDKPSEIILADTETYEILYCDPSGNQIAIVTDKIKEESAPKNPSGENDRTENTEGESKNTSVTETSSKTTSGAANNETSADTTSGEENTESTKPLSGKEEQNSSTLPQTAGLDNIGDGSIFDE